MAATGLQIAILIALFEVSFAIITYYIEPAIGWPREHSKLLGNALSFGTVLILLLAIAPLRRYLRSELARPLPRRFLGEVALVSLAKTAIPFAFLAATFLSYTLLSGTPDQVAQLTAKDPGEIARRYFTGMGLFDAIAITMIIGPFVEEVVFRGFLYGAWERQWGWVPAMLATSLCFGLIHPGTIAQTFVGSVVYVCILRRTGTLWGPILAHMIYNALVTWPLLGHMIMAKPADGIERPEAWTLEFVCLGFAIVAVPVYIWMARTKRTPDTP